MKLSKREKRLLKAAERVRETDARCQLERSTVESFRERQRDLGDQERAARERLRVAECESQDAYAALYVAAVGRDS